MHLAPRGYFLIVLSAVLAIVGVWSDQGALARLWTVPVGLLLLGLALEGTLVRRQRIAVRIAMAARAFLGRPQPAAFEFTNPSARALALEYAPALPEGFQAADREPPRERCSRDVHGRCHYGTARAPRTAALAELPARLRGPFALAWWSILLQPEYRGVVAPDALRSGVRMRAMAGGARARRIVGAGAELHQLRAYVRGDPLSRIDWKATARTRALVTREYTEDQHLDLLVAIDAGRLSRVRSGALEHFGLYSNLTARLAELATHHDDRIGLVMYADRVLGSCAPERGVSGVIRVRRMLERAAPAPRRVGSDQRRGGDSSPAQASLAGDPADGPGRRQHRHAAGPGGAGCWRRRTWSWWPASSAARLPRSVRVRRRPGKTRGSRSRPRNTRSVRSSQRAVLERLGVPVVAAVAERLEPALFNRYEQLRRSRRI